MLKKVCHGTYDLWGPAQREALWRDFTYHGWEVSVTAKSNCQDPTAPERDPGEWLCRAFHGGWVFDPIETEGESLWDCLSKMAERIVAVYEGREDCGFIRGEEDAKA
jgi:hypothetical protein